MANTYYKDTKIYQEKPMKYTETHLKDVFLIEPKLFGDHRGFFMETWQQNDFTENVCEVSFVQDNHSKSTEHTLRGLHYQIIKPQGKLVRVTKGSVFDVAVDIRQTSPTYGKWIGVELSEENRKMLWVPPGFAHGFYVTSKSAEFLYKCTDYYYPEHERSLLWSDPAIGIEWPIKKDLPPLLSEKDKSGMLLADTELFRK